MANTPPPITTWRPGDIDGAGEITQSDGAFIDTENDFDLITEAGDNLIIESSIFTPTPQTVWHINDSQ